MEPAQERWIEELSLYFERLGLAKSIGRIVGLLMLSPRPVTLDELAAELSISKASASLGTRFGDQAGFIQRVNRSGERKAFYRLSDDFWYRSLAVRLESHRQMRDLVVGALHVLREEPSDVRERMEDMRDFLTYYLEEYPRMYARWMEQRRGPAKGVTYDRL